MKEKEPSDKGISDAIERLKMIPLECLDEHDDSSALKALRISYEMEKYMLERSRKEAKSRVRVLEILVFCLGVSFLITVLAFIKMCY